MVVTLIEFGLPLLSKAERTCPGLLRAKLSNHYSYRQRERLSVILDRLADKQQLKMKLAAGIFVSMTQQSRDSIHQEAKTRNKYMSQIARERMGLPY